VKKLIANSFEDRLSLAGFSHCELLVPSQSYFKTLQLDLHPHITPNPYMYFNPSKLFRIPFYFKGNYTTLAVLSFGYNKQRYVALCELAKLSCDFKENTAQVQNKRCATRKNKFFATYYFFFFPSILSHPLPLAIMG
jgi:hypothetical protein